MKKNHILGNAILIIALMLSFSSSNLNSQQWPPLGSCYTEGNCTRTAHSIVLEYKGCTVVVVYQVIYCPPGRYQFRIDYITYSAGGNCVNLHLYLHPDDNFEPNAERLYANEKGRV